MPVSPIQDLRHVEVARLGRGVRIRGPATDGFVDDPEAHRPEGERFSDPCPLGPGRQPVDIEIGAEAAPIRLAASGPDESRMLAGLIIVITGASTLPK